MANSNGTVGVLLARLQPIHNGHLALIEKSFRENERTFVFIGSAQTSSMNEIQYQSTYAWNWPNRPS